MAPPRIASEPSSSASRSSASARPTRAPSRCASPCTVSTPWSGTVGGISSMGCGGGVIASRTWATRRRRWLRAWRSTASGDKPSRAATPVTVSPATRAMSASARRGLVQTVQMRGMEAERAGRATDSALPRNRGPARERPPRQGGAAEGVGQVRGVVVDMDRLGRSLVQAGNQGIGPTKATRGADGRHQGARKAAARGKPRGPASGVLPTTALPEARDGPTP